MNSLKTRSKKYEKLTVLVLIGTGNASDHFVPPCISRYICNMDFI